MNGLTVVWDGTDRTSRYLDYQPPPPQPPRVRGSLAELRDDICRALADGPASMRELAAGLMESVDHVNRALFTLQKHGRVESAGMRPRPPGLGRGGPREERLYRVPACGPSSPCSSV